MENIYDTKQTKRFRVKAERFRNNTTKILPPKVELPPELKDLASAYPSYVQQALSNLYFRDALISTKSESLSNNSDGVMLLAETLHMLWSIKMFNSGLTWNHISGPHYDRKLLDWQTLKVNFPTDAKFFVDQASDMIKLLNINGFTIAE